MKLKFAIVILIPPLFVFSFNNNGYGHNFYKNHDSIFFTLLKQLTVEKDLTRDSISSNKSVSTKHSQNVDTLLEQLRKYDFNITRESNFVDKYNATFNDLNLTTKAIVAANFADESLREYGLAKGFDPHMAAGLLNMSLGMITQMGNPTTNMTMNTTQCKIVPDSSFNSVKSDNQILDKVLSLESNQIVNKANYESSKMIAESLKSLFSDNLQNADLQNSTGLMRIPMSMKTESIIDLQKGIDNLILALNNKASLEEVYSIVHAQIHPNLFLAFDLKLND